MKKILGTINLKDLKDEKSTVKYAVELVHVANEFVSDCTLITDHKRIDVKSILGLMSLCFQDGKIIELEISGVDEDKAEEALSKIL